MSSKPGPEMKEPTPKQVVQFVRQHRKPFVTSSDVADNFPDVSDRTLRERLNDLVEDGELKVRKVGANSKVWFDPGYSSEETASASCRLPSSESQ
jgi:DeoR/GlpR family transcriptional regulator of sugar metabolism